MLEERVAKIEGIISQMNERLNHLSNDIADLKKEVNERINKLDTKIDKLEETVNERIDKLDDKIEDVRKEIRSNLKWILGVLLPMWASIIIAIILR